MNIKNDRRHALFAFLAFAAGWLFYVSIRRFDPLHLLTLDASPPGSRLEGFWMAASPSFLHAVALLFLFRIAFRSRTGYWAAWLGSTVGYEAVQAFWPAFGGFDWRDMTAIALAGLPGFLIADHQRRCPESAEVRRYHPAALPSLIFATLTSIASSYGPDHQARPTHVPICMNLTELRGSFASEAPHPWEAAGRVYVHGDYLLVGEPFAGIHIYDNADPKTPLPLMFLRIPGNTDMVMKDSYLYADSSIDLLTIEFADGTATLVNRQEGVFEARTVAEFTDDTFLLDSEKVRECQDSGGTVVGYRDKVDGEDIKKKIEENRND